MRILFTTAWYPNRKVAGDGVFIQKHAQAVARLNDVAVLMVQTDVKVRGWHIDVEVREPSDTLHEVLVYVPKVLHEVPVLTGLLRLFWLMAGYLKGYGCIRQRWWQGRDAEVCHVNVLTRAAGLPWLLWRMRGIPYIITEHWTRYARQGAYPQSALQLRLGRRFVRDAAYVCPVSYNLEKAMKRWGLASKQYVRIGNVVDTELFALPAERRADGVVRLVHVSWMRDDAKNISGILRTLARLKEERTDWHLDLVGEGNDKPMLEELARQLGLDGCVTFLPARQGADLADCLRQHDALLMFSHIENQPVSVLEALACGLPVIATEVGEIPVMLAQGRGLTVEPGREDQLLEVLRNFVALHKSLHKNEAQTDAQLAKAGEAAQQAKNNEAATSKARQRHEYVAMHHSPQVIGQRFDVLYHAALSKSVGRQH